MKLSSKIEFVVVAIWGKKLEKIIWVESKELKGGFNIFRE